MEDIPVSLIEPSEIRVDPNYDVDDLVDSLRVQGQLSAIKVRPHRSLEGKYEVIFGNRRLRAATILGWKTVKAEIVEVSEWQKFSMALAENLDRRNFSDYEIALLIEKLHLVSGKTYDDIASLIKRSNAFVSQHVSMLRLFSKEVGSTEEISRALNSITERHARVLARIENMDERWNIAKLAISANLGLRELQRLASHHFERRLNSDFRDSKKILVSLINDVIKGVNSNDLRPLFVSRSPNAYSLFSQFPPYTKLNKSMAEDHLTNLIQASTSGLRVRLQELELKIYGNFAYATMYIVHEIRYDRKILTDKTRTTMIFAKEDNEWKIVHEHFSPIDSSEMRVFLDHLAGLKQPTSHRFANPRKYR